MSHKKIFLVLTILAAAIIGWPFLHFQSIFSQGDIGRDLYVFDQVLHGKLVYKDMWWVYGPLMPYYYGLFFLIFGFKITSILLGKFVLTILGGAFFYMAGAVVMPPLWAFLAACSFLQYQQDFFFTYNHIGAITLSLAVFWLILKYLYERQIYLGLYALGLCFCIGLIKINFGLSALAVTLLSITLINFAYTPKNLLTRDNKPFYLAGLTAVPLLWLAIYAFFFNGLNIYEIRQCMPYFGDDQPYHRTIFETIPYFVTQHYLTFYHHFINFLNILNSWSQDSSHMLGNPLALLMTAIVSLTFLTHPILHGSTMAAFVLSFSKKFDERRKMFWMTQAVIWLFFILNFHEFVVSGIWYRTFWSQPFLLFFGFFMIATAMSLSPKWLRATVAGIWISLFALLTFVSFASTKSSCTPNKFLNMPRGQIYVGNEAPWVDTVNTVTNFLNKTLAPGEQFLALPYDPLYYYLTGRPSPTRQLIFFDHIKISQEQEISIIKELEKNKIDYVLLSNRAMSKETGLGVFGKTYCPLLSQYITDNFTAVYRYGGNWNKEPGTNENHGVIIFKRK